MKIKNRLSLYFALITAVILFVALFIIYFAFNSIVRTDFDNRLLDRAKVAAQLYLKADEISSDSLSNVRKRYLRQLTGEVMRFYDNRNAPKFINDNNQHWNDKIINLVRKRHELIFTEGDHQSAGIYYKDNQGDFVILVSAIDIQGNKRLDDLIEIMAVFMITSLALLFFVGRWFAQKSLKPLDDMVQQMQQVRASNLSMRINEGNGKDEISRLAQNFNRLLMHLENAFELQQSFVTNASHELRTPVTSIIGEVEVALHKDRSVQEYDLLLRSVLADAERLKETITGLLELAQVDMNYTQAILSPVAIDELIWEVNDYWTKRIGKGMFTVNILGLPEDPEKLSIPANKALLTIALNNIIGNAYKFSNNKPVQCDLYIDNAKITITITDQGIGIPTAEAQKVFESFYRAGNVASHHGNGIGLYVTHKIISLFNGSITIDAAQPQGTAVKVEFKR
ncbi:MAG: ATP-binding protein [Mucilaginibacter sp.]